MTAPEPGSSGGSGTRLVLEPPCKFINSNDRDHHYTKARLTASWRELARAQAAFLVANGITHERVHIYAWFRFPTNHRRDVANLYGTCKAAIDGAVEAGLLALGDHDGVVVGPDMRRERPNGTPRLILEFREIAA